jgi:hypothetical protein
VFTSTCLYPWLYYIRVTRWVFTSTCLYPWLYYIRVTRWVFTSTCLYPWLYYIRVTRWVFTSTCLYPWLFVCFVLFCFCFCLFYFVFAFLFCFFFIFGGGGVCPCCSVFILFLLWPMVPVSLNYLFSIFLSVFSNVYLWQWLSRYYLTPWRCNACIHFLSTQVIGRCKSIELV